MSAGPILIFDKSLIEMLSPDEAVWLGQFYRVNIVPVFLVETLADLEKEVAAGRTPEQVVGRLFYLYTRHVAIRIPSCIPDTIRQKLIGSKRRFV